MSGLFRRTLNIVELDASQAAQNAAIAADQQAQDDAVALSQAAQDDAVALSQAAQDDAIGRAARQRPAGWGVYTEELDGSLAEAAEIAALGVSYVIYFFHGGTNAARIANALTDLANLDSLGIGVILLPKQTIVAADWTAVAAEFAAAPNLIGWYVLDEPSAHAYTIAQQDAILAAARALLNIPCYTADNGDSWPTLTLSPGYDFVFFNPYFQIVNAGVPFNSQANATRWYANVHCVGVYRPERLIAVYETYLDAADPAVDSAAFLKAMRAKADLWGPGALFVYSAAKTVPAMKTIANTAQISGIARALLSTPATGRKVVSFSVPLVNASSGFTTGRKRAMLASLVDARSTATIEFAPARLPARSGIFMAAGQFVVLDFGQVLRSVRLSGRFFNHTSAAGTVSTFDVQIPEAVDGSSGSTLETIAPATDGAGQAVWNSGVYSDINSRYLVLRATGANWSSLTGFDCIAANAIA